MVSAPERAERAPGPDMDQGPGGRRPRRRGRAIAVLAVLALGGVGVAVTWPRAEPSIVSDKVNPPSPVDPNAAASPCTAEDLDVGLAADRLAVTPGEPVRFTVSVRNEGEVQCLVDAPRRNLAVTVYQGEVGEATAKRVWSSADCADAEEERLLLLGPGDVDVTETSWSDARSVPGCEPGQPRLSAGEYTAQVTLADVEGATSDVVRLTYTVPEPSGSPSPSASGSALPSGSPSPSASEPGEAGTEPGEDAGSERDSSEADASEGDSSEGDASKRDAGPSEKSAQS
ncbi:hypothetical protein ACIG47_22690 [Promicromonospora sp. NPDC052451]|uniref:hypothetical protein n=1 Tax=Promicromonospora sp. NPDC052451 TaxID=3364407 RepID=UPI0037CA1D3F